MCWAEHKGPYTYKGAKETCGMVAEWVAVRGLQSIVFTAV